MVACCYYIQRYSLSWLDPPIPSRVPYQDHTQNENIRPICLNVYQLFFPIVILLSFLCDFIKGVFCTIIIFPIVVLLSIIHEIVKANFVNVFSTILLTF